MVTQSVYAESGESKCDFRNGLQLLACPASNEEFGKMIYLASPYTHVDAAVRESRFRVSRFMFLSSWL